MTSVPQPLGRLRNELERCLRRGESSLYLHKTSASLIDHRPTNMLGRGAIAFCFVLGRRQAGLFVRYAARNERHDGRSRGYVAKDLQAGARGFVLKLLCPRPDLVRTADAVVDIQGRFRKEGRLGTTLARHEHVVPTFASAPLVVHLGPWAHVKTAATLVEYAGARTLEDAVEDRRRSLRSRLALGLQLCSAVTHLHSHGILHRDIKPTNIFLDQRSIRIGDLGVHRTVQRQNASLTETGQEGIGTYKYMSPEQAADSKRCGPAADVFSLGVTLFELLLGRDLGKRDDVLGLAGMSRSGRRLEIDELASALPTLSYSPRIPVDSESLRQRLVSALGPSLRWNASHRPNAAALEHRLRVLSETL